MKKTLLIFNITSTANSFFWNRIFRYPYAIRKAGITVAKPWGGRRYPRRKIASLISLLVLVMVLSGCGTVKLAVRKDTNLTYYKNIYIVPTISDPLGVEGKLINKFIESGFNILTQGGIKNILIDKQLTDYAYDLSSYITLKKIASLVGIDAIVTYRYNHYWDVFYWSFTSFEMRFTDVKTGEVIVSGTFTGDASVKSVIKSFFDKLNNTIRTMPEPLLQPKIKIETKDVI